MGGYLTDMSGQSGKHLIVDLTLTQVGCYSNKKNVKSVERLKLDVRGRK